MSGLQEKYPLNGDFVRDFISRFGGMVPTARDLQEARRYPDSFSAVRGAIAYFYPLSVIANLAFSGVVYRTEGKKEKYACAGSVICTGTRSIQHSPVKIQNCVSAFWRTSGQTGIDNRYFSDEETRLSNNYRIPFYLCNHAGMLKSYQPGDSTLSPEIAHRMLAIREPGFALGTLVHDNFGRIVKVGSLLQPQHFRQYEELSVTPVSMALFRYANTRHHLHR